MHSKIKKKKQKKTPTEADKGQNMIRHQMKENPKEK